MPSGNRGLWYLRVRAKHGDPKRRKRRSTRPHFGRGPVYIGGGGGGTGRARARFNGRRRVRLDAQRSRRRVQSTIRATGVQRRYTRCTDTKNANGTDFALIVSCSTLASSDWRYWYIRKNKKKKKKHLPAPDDCSAANRRATLPFKFVLCDIRTLSYSIIQISMSSVRLCKKYLKI